MAVFSVTAITALLFANMFTFISLNAQGNDRSLTLLQSIHLLFQGGDWPLGLIILTVIIVLPLLFSGSLNLLLYAIHSQNVSAKLFSLLRAIKAFQFWNMAEIYFLGVLVSIVKVVSLADISLGPSFWFFGLFCMAQLAAMQYLDSFQLANQLRAMIQQRSGVSAVPEDASGGELNCPHCGELQASTNKQCRLCSAPINHRKADSLQRTWLFLITGVLLYIPANLLPIMTTTTLGQSEPSTIVGGVLLLWEHGSYPIATVIFVASIAVPIGKFLVLLVLVAGEQFQLLDHPQAQITAYRVTEFIGRWSMVDVFVVAFLAGLIQMGNLMTIIPGPAVLAFAAMVVSTMLAAESFEPKMFWDQYE